MEDKTIPTYTYKCNNTNCNHQYDIVQRISEDSITKCPECGEQTLQRVLGATPTIFKGKGWYDKGGY